MSTDNKKIGIVTLHGYGNYGNKLQNFALKEVSQSLGFETYTLVITNEKQSINIYKDKLIKLMQTSPSKLIKTLIDKNNNQKIFEENKKLVDLRTKIFKEFSKKYLGEQFVRISNDNMHIIQSEYEYFITGSDQVWNPVYISEMHNYFLTFAKEEQRIAYAPSLSCSEIPAIHREKYRNWLNGMSKISVREEEGARIIKELIGIDVPVLLDPTLLINKEKWLSIAKKAKNRPEHGYILTYFLGEISKEDKSYIKKISFENEMDIINLADVHDIEAYATGPEEFIDYINSASVFFTDSFHGCVFSILLETPFVDYERKTRVATMYSRIETLLNKFDLKNRKIENLEGDLFNMDFSHVPQILELERNKSIDYLKDALNIKDV